MSIRIMTARVRGRAAAVKRAVGGDALAAAGICAIIPRGRTGGNDDSRTPRLHDEAGEPGALLRAAGRPRVRAGETHHGAPDRLFHDAERPRRAGRPPLRLRHAGGLAHAPARPLSGGGAAVLLPGQIGRASCRERVCQYVSISVVAVSLKKKKTKTKK